MSAGECQRTALARDIASRIRSFRGDPAVAEEFDRRADALERFKYVEGPEFEF